MGRDSPQTPYINLISIQVQFDLRVETLSPDCKSCTGCKSSSHCCTNKQEKHARAAQTQRQVEAKSRQADTHAIDHV